MARSTQYGDRVNVIKYVRVQDKWRFAATVKKRGRIIRDHVSIAGRNEHHPEGRYFIEWYELGKRRRRSVGDFENVADAARRKGIELDAVEVGILRAQVEPVKAGDTRTTMAAAIDSYLDFVRHHRSVRTYRTYRYTLDVLLRESYTKPYIDQVARADALKFIADCYKRGLGSRTVYDKLVVVLQLFKRHGKTRLIESSDWPEYVETIRPIYEAEEIEVLLRHAEEDEGIFLKFLLGSGFRDREVRHVTWRDIDLRNSLVRVTTKPMWGFRPKNWEERAVPLPTSLIEQLRRLKENRNALPAQLVFPNSRGNPDSPNSRWDFGGRDLC